MATGNSVTLVPIECPQCEGRGSLKYYAYSDEGHLIQKERPCSACHKSGYVFAKVHIIQVNKGKACNTREGSNLP